LVRHWSDENLRHGRTVNFFKYTVYYAGLVTAQVTLICLGRVVLTAICNTNAGAHFNEKLALTVFSSPMSFFDVTPGGQIINRFVKDISDIEAYLG
jgi:hypothetical protein